MLAVFIAIRLNREQFRGKAVTVFCDNLPVVWMIRKFRAPLHRPDLQLILIELAKLLIGFEINVWMEHVEGETNKTADALSRFFPQPLKDCVFTDLVPIKSRKVQVATQRIADKCKKFIIERRFLAK